ncbi:MAG: hypothetical protein ACREP7_06355, partial [Lysobacter sp.]
PGYDKVLAYWEGKGPRPSREQAREALLTLATHDVRMRNNAQHPDVVDAWLRAPRDDRSLPFKPHRIARAGGELAAVDFDLGRNGVAYFDRSAANESGKPNSAWNASQLYRNDGVDLIQGDDGLRVAAMQDGEWLKYTIDVEAAGAYSLTVRGKSGTTRAKVNGDALAPVGVNRPQPVALLGGRNTLVIEAVSGQPDPVALRLTPVNGDSR